MKIVHLVPAAWDYFDDIRDAVFNLVSGEIRRGIESEVITLQYRKTTPQAAQEISVKSSGLSFRGDLSGAGLADVLDEFDLVHLHCPFLGAAKDILAWKKKNPKKPLLISIHRPVRIVDFFSLIIAAYNTFYQPKIFSLADRRLTFPANGVKLSQAEATASVYSRIYQDLLNN